MISHQGTEPLSADVWQVGKVRPPVTYGVVPPGAAGSTPEPLVAGQPYHAQLWLELSTGFLIVTAQRDFVPE
jgi:hypothetical protein